MYAQGLVNDEMSKFIPSVYPKYQKKYQNIDMKMNKKINKNLSFTLRTEQLFHIARFCACYEKSSSVVQIKNNVVCQKWSCPDLFHT